MANTPGLQLFDISLWAQTLSTIGVSGSTNKAGAVYIAPKTGNVRYVGFLLTTSAVAGTLEVRVETVSSSRVPSGTLQGTNTNNASVSSPAVNTFSWFQLTADAAVTAGDATAGVVQWVSTANVSVAYSTGRNTSSGPYGCNNTGSWSTTQSPPLVCLKYDDGTIIAGGLPINTLSAAGFKSGTNPNERAVVFTPQFNCTCSGAKVLGYPDNAATTWTLGLYSGTSTSPTATVAVPANYGAALFNENIFDIRFASPVSLTSGQAYRLAVLATNASNNFNLFRWTFPSTAERDMVMGAATADTRNGGAWVGEVTTTSELICPIIDTVTASSSGGGGNLLGRGTLVAA